MAKLEDPEELIMPEQERDKVDSARSARIGPGKLNSLSSGPACLARFSIFPEVCNRRVIDPNVRLFLSLHVFHLADFTKYGRRRKPSEDTGLMGKIGSARFTCPEGHCTVSSG